MSFTGEVPAALRSSKIPSSEAHHRVKSRLQKTVVFFVVALTLLLGRVVMLQTIQRHTYFAASVDQRTRINILRAARGVIFDRNGNELALSVPSTTVYADPRDITDFPAVAHALSVALAYTPEQEARLLAALSAPGSKFSYIARGMTKQNAQTLLGLDWLFVKQNRLHQLGYLQQLYLWQYCRLNSRPLVPYHNQYLEE